MHTHGCVLEGIYQLNLVFKIGIGGFAMDPHPGATPLPGAVVGVEGVTLEKIPDGMALPNAVDAALVNPAPKPKAMPRAKKAV